MTKMFNIDTVMLTSTFCHGLCLRSRVIKLPACLCKADSSSWTLQSWFHATFRYFSCGTFYTTFTNLGFIHNYTQKQTCQHKLLPTFFWNCKLLNPSRLIWYTQAPLLQNCIKIQLKSSSTKSELKITTKVK